MVIAIMIVTVRVGIVELARTAKGVVESSTMLLLLLLLLMPLKGRSSD
jgi:hypothetical protein